jgi:uncharacterized membrane protein
VNIHDGDPSAIFHEMGARVRLPPPRITAAELVAAGRRARRRRGMAVGGAAALALGLVAVAGATFATGPGRPGRGGWSVLAPTAASTAGRCSAARLPVPAGAARVDVSAAAPGGRYLAGSAHTGPAARPLLWDGDRVVELTVQAFSAEANAVNDAGLVVGDATATDGRSFGWAYAGGGMVKLPLPAGYTSAEATAVSARGDVAGNAWGGGRGVTAVVWRGVGAAIRVYRLDAPGPAMAFGISDAGAVVGELDGVAAYLWDANGLGRTLPGPAGTEGGRAAGVRGDWAYGSAGTPGGGTAIPPLTSGAPSGSRVPSTVRPPFAVRTPVLVSTPSTRSTPPAPAARAVLWDVSTGRPTEIAGDRIGAVTSEGQAAVNTAQGAALRDTDGSVRPLPDLTSGGHSEVSAMSNDAATVAGTSTDGTGSRQPVRWRC